MEMILRKVGNSTALTFPQGLLRDLGIQAGQSLTLEKIKNGVITLVVQKQKPRYTLDELLAQCDINAEQPEDLALWDAAEPVGREVIQ